jgi:hypothetical protein
MTDFFCFVLYNCSIGHIKQGFSMVYAVLMNNYLSGGNLKTSLTKSMVKITENNTLLCQFS